ncbi:MAG: hypothetical protein ACI9W2_004575 [Gammaproteobacteria bacterium]|jgi:hypothetical protein
MLRNVGISTLVIGGVVTNACVETTARDACDRGFDVVLVDEACAAFSPEAHVATMLALQGPFATVRNADDVIALLDPQTLSLLKTAHRLSRTARTSARGFNIPPPAAHPTVRRDQVRPGPILGLRVYATSRHALARDAPEGPSRPYRRYAHAR